MILAPGLRCDVSRSFHAWISSLRPSYDHNETYMRSWYDPRALSPPFLRPQHDLVTGIYISTMCGRTSDANETTLLHSNTNMYGTPNRTLMLIFWYQKFDFLISEIIFWYQKFDFLISEIIFWYQKNGISDGTPNRTLMLIFWYQKMIFWYQKMCEFLISENHFLISENQFLI